jgi:hypothetical protein
VVVENAVVVWNVVDGWGMVAVVVTTVLVAVAAVAVALPLVGVWLVELLDVVVCVWVVRALSGGTGTIVPSCLTETVVEVPESLDARDPAVACCDEDLTAVPTPKPMASAASSAAPSSTHRRRTVADLAPFTSP